MKKISSILICFAVVAASLALVAVLTGFGSNSGLSDLKINQSAISNKTADFTPAPEPTEKPYKKLSYTDDVDIDLTAMSDTVAYSEFCNITAEPENYVGKTVKMKGLFSYDNYDNKEHFMCIMQDATMCCAPNIEFTATEEYTYPEDYPAQGFEMCVVGKIGLRQENDYTYGVLEDAILM